MNDELTTRLSRQLHDQVDGWQDAPLTLAGVQGRARTIRRRRQALTSGVVAAAVLAVAVPVGISLGARTDTTPDVTSPSPTRMVDEAPTPRADGTFPLTPLEAPEGTAPVTGYVSLADSVLHTSEGEQQLPDGLQQVERFGDGWIGLALGQYDDTDNGSHLVRFDADYRVVDEFPAANLVVDAAGEHAAWTEVDGDAWTIVQATPEQETARTSVRRDAQVVGHLTDGRVVFQSPDYETGNDLNGILDAEGAVEPIEGVLRMLDASDATGQVSALTRYGVKSCYALLDPVSGNPTFETCDFATRAISPDGSLVVGRTAGEDGVGSPQLAILDAVTGEPLVEWTSDRGDRSPALVQQVVWEDDDTLLATVTEGSEQTVVRAELDGSMQRVAEPVEVQMSIAYTLADAVVGLD